MTLPTSTRVTDPYETDGVQRDFEFDFPAFYNADTGHYGIEVRRLTALDYEVIDKSLYDIFLNDEDKSGYVRFHVAPMAGDDIYIAGDTTRSQQLNLINYGRYSAQSIEKAFDLIVALIQEFVSKVDEETRQRILADQALRDFLLIKFNQFTAEVTTKIDKHIGDINGFMSSLIPMYVCIMRKEIAYYAETQLDSIIDAKLSDLSTQVANAIAENDAALIRLNESILKIDAAITATAIGARLFDTPAAGVHPVTGVPVGSYFNVRSPNADSYVDEYRNVGGVATATGKTYPSAASVEAAVEESSELKGLITDPLTNEIIPIRNSDKLKRENLSVWDFFTPSELAMYKASPTVFDAYRPLKEFSDYIISNDVRVAYCSGDFALSQALVHGSGSSATKVVFGNVTFRALNAIDTLFNINAGSDFTWLGMITAIGTGSAGSNSYNSRTCRVGVQISSSGKSSPRNKYTAITANNFKEFGVFVDGVGSLSSLGFIRSSNCGSGKSTAGYSLTANFSNPVNSGSSGSVSQLTVLEVDKLPAEDIVSTTTNSLPILAVINGQTYYIQSIDRANNKISIFPWIDPAVSSGTLIYMFGGAVCVNGGDSSVLGIEMIDAVNCGALLVSGALYPPVVERIVSQFNGAALVLGQNPSSAMIGGSIGLLYCENNDFDLIRVTRAQLSFNIQNTVAFNVNKVAFTSAPKSTAGAYTAFNNLQGIPIYKDGVLVQYQRNSANYTTTAGCDVTDPNNSDFIYNAGAAAANINLLVPSDFYADSFGIYKKRVVVYGTGVGSKPVSVTFNLVDSVNYTIDSAGVTTKAYDGFDGFAVFDVIYRSSLKRFFISQVSNRDRSATVTYNPPSIAAGASTTTTVTLTGVSLGAVVQAGFSQYNADIEISASVSAANTVTVKFKNTGAAPVDLASGTLTVKSI